MQKTIITIEARIPDRQFSHESREMFIKAVVALFKGWFPDAVENSESKRPPITVNFESEDETSRLFSK